MAFDDELRQAVRAGKESAPTSSTKWAQVEALLASELGIRAGDVKAKDVKNSGRLANAPGEAFKGRIRLGVLMVPTAALAESAIGVCQRQSAVGPHRLDALAHVVVDDAANWLLYAVEFIDRALAEKLVDLVATDREGVKLISAPDIATSSRDGSEDDASVWIEFTHSSNKSDVEGWRLGECVWSPSTNKAGRDTYKTMREAAPRDYVVHVADRHFVGVSRVSAAYDQVAEDPPMAGEWAGRPPYYRVKTGGYRSFPSRLALAEFLSRHEDSVRSELSQGTPTHYPFVKHGTRIQAALNGYLYRCTARLAKLLDEELGLWSTPTDRSSQDDTRQPSRQEESVSFEDVFQPLELVHRVLRLLRAGRNVVLQGPPGVGKSYLARRLVASLVDGATTERVQTVQFHQSFAYEDFVRGWRPKESGSFELVDGIFKRFCDRASGDSRPHVFVIDEINRANLAKVLGEVMVLIEHDKRGPDFAVPLAYPRAPDERFSVPESVRLLGLMNTADRSLALVDYALRRRFVFVTLEPVFGDSFRRHHEKAGTSAEMVASIVELVSELNDAIASDDNLGPGFRIGHSFFCATPGTPCDEEWFRDVIDGEIRPLLSEYYFDGAANAPDAVRRLLAS